MSTRPAPGTQRPHRLSRLAALLSLRTISGKLIIGLVVLFGVASVMVSVVTSSSLNKSLMSSVDQQLQSATMRWQNCVSSAPDDDTDLHHGTGQGPLPACLRSGRRHVRGRADRQYLLQPQPGAREMRALRRR